MSVSLSLGNAGLRKLDLNGSRVVILVEGLTEEILLPYLARARGLDLVAMGAKIVPAGGAQKLVRQYSRLKERTHLPIFCLFDQDAHSWAEQVSSQLRPNDYVHVIADGEIEDLVQLEFFVNQLNNYLTADCLNDTNTLVAVSDFSSPQKRTAILDQIWRKKQLGKFEKVKFARFLTQDLSNQDTISADGKLMLDKLLMSFNWAAGL